MSVELSDLTELAEAPQSDDVLAIYDTSTGILKKITPSNLVVAYNTALAALAALTPSASQIPVFTSASTASLLSLLNLNFSRAQFTYIDAGSFTIKVGAASYFCKEKQASWDTELTTSAIGTPSSSEWYYLYLDYSAITSGTAITATELIWSATEPSWDGTYKGWYNGDDRCIFAVYINGAGYMLNFGHNGYFVQYGQEQSIMSSVNTTDSYVDTDPLLMPSFTKHGQAMFYYFYVDTETRLFWKTNGQTSYNEHEICRIDSDLTSVINITDVFTDSSHIIEWKEESSSNNTANLASTGFYLPIGI